jgi:hypothetical protein
MDAAADDLFGLFHQLHKVLLVNDLRSAFGVSGCRLQVSGFRFKVPDCNVLRFAFQVVFRATKLFVFLNKQKKFVKNFRFQVQSSRFRVQGSRFQVQSSRFKVSGFRFQV